MHNSKVPSSILGGDTIPFKESTMNKFIRKWFLTSIDAEWEDTDLNFTPNGPRKTGKFTAKSFITAWLWGQAFVFFKPRAGVYISKPI